MKTIPLQAIADAPGQTAPLRSHYEAKAFGFVDAVWRRKWMVIAITLGAIIAAVTTIPMLERRYTADALIQLDLTESRPAAGAAAPNLALDAAAVVESEARIIRSRTIARRVVVRLDLVHDAAFEPRPSLGEQLRQTIRSGVEWISKSPVAPVEIRNDDPIAKQLAVPPVDLVVLEVMKGLEVRNDARSYLISVVYTATSPENAARLANAFAEEYLQSRIEASAATASRTSSWLRTQIAEAKAALNAAEGAVQHFREKTGFVEAGGDGVGVKEQQLIDANTQLSAATALRVTKAARLEHIKEMVVAGNVPSTSDLAGSPVVQGLLESEVAAKREVARLSTLGARHPLLVVAQSALKEVQARLKEELDKAVAVLEGDLDAAIAAEQALIARAADLQRETIEVKASEQKLSNLQDQVDILQDRLKALTGSQQQTTALAELQPVTAKLVMPAESIGLPSTPKPKIILALTVFGALCASLGIVFVLEQKDTGFRTDVEVSQDLGIPCLGMIPRLRKSARRSERLAFHEAARAVAAGLGNRVDEAKVVLVTSALPEEGKTVLAYALAGSIVSSGRSVLILNAGSGERIRPPASARVMLNLEEVLLQEDKRGTLLAAQARDLPVVIQCNSALAGLEDIFASPAFEVMLESAKSLYDVVLVEVPAVMLFADALVLGRHADTVLHVIRWNSTPRKAVESALRRLSVASLRPSGTVLSLVDSRVHRRYAIRDEIYYRRKYARQFARSRNQVQAKKSEGVA